MTRMCLFHGILVLCLCLIRKQVKIYWILEWKDAFQSFTYFPAFLSQRVNQCFRDACRDSGIGGCMSFIDCGHGNEIEDSQVDDPLRDSWKNNVNASACFNQNGFDYGIYNQAVNLTTENSIMTRYVYALFWGFQVLLLLLPSLASIISNYYIISSCIPI